MIESITIKNIATFDTVDGVKIEGLKKVNFFYGANGSGKTTIANFLQNHSDTKFSDCLVSWKNSQAINTLVYNKEFREKNFGKGKIDGVFTLGEATKEEKRVIDEKTEQLKIIKSEGEKIRGSIKWLKPKKRKL